MDTNSCEYYKKLAKDIMFDITDQEAEELKDEFKVLLEQIDVLDEINTDGVEEMVFPFESETAYLREDIIDHVISQDEALSNVKSAKAGHVHVPKVVK